MAGVPRSAAPVPKGNAAPDISSRHNDARDIQITAKDLAGPDLQLGNQDVSNCGFGMPLIY